MTLTIAYDSAGRGVDMDFFRGSSSYGIEYEVIEELDLGGGYYGLEFSISGHPVLTSALIAGYETYDNVYFTVFEFYSDGAIALSLSEFEISSADLATKNFRTLFEGSDEIYGAGFDDKIQGYLGSDFIYGRGGNDTIIADAGDDVVSGGPGDDSISGGPGYDWALINVRSSSIEVSQGGNGEVIISSSLGTDTYAGVEAFEFSDRQVQASVLIEEYSSNPNDPENSIMDGPNINQIFGTAVSEGLQGTEGPDEIGAQAGDDYLRGKGGDDTLRGGDGNDTISASSGNDSVSGGSDSDFIGGGEGRDTIDGGTGNDIIGAGSGNDFVVGGEGTDVIAGGDGADSLSGSGGSDTIGGSYSGDLVSGDAGNDSLGGGFGMDTIDGGAGSDSIGGGEGSDVVNGNGGDDFLAGGGRNDFIRGGAGDDLINGGDGDDTMIGGDGADQFIFNDLVSGDTDTVLEFEDGQDTFRITGVGNAPGSGLQGYVEALNIMDTTVDGEAGVSMSVGGHIILVQGVSASELDLENFTFL